MTIPAPYPDNEHERLMRLHQLDVLGAEAEPLFDGLTRAAALVVDSPIALISLIDSDRQWFMSNHGLEEVSETPRDIAFCAHAILGDDLMEVPDAQADRRFADNPLVTGKPNIRFYAGAPITLSDGLTMGTLCVFDRLPRALTSRQRSILRELAAAAAAAIEQRLHARERSFALESQVQAERLLADDRTRLSNIIEATGAGTWEWDVQGGEFRINDRWAEIIGYTAIELEPVDFDTWRSHTDDESWERLRAQIDAHLNGESPYLDCDARLLHKDGRRIWVRCRGRVIKRTEAGQPWLMCGTEVDISARKDAERRLHVSEALLDRAGRIAGVGGWELDIQKSEITWTDQTCRILEVPLGYRPSLQEALNFFAPEARQRAEQAVSKAIVDGSSWDLELPVVTAKGRAIWVREMGAAEYEDGRPRWLFGAMQETTLRRRAVNTLEISERRFRKLFQHSLGLICTHDLDGNLISLNPAAAEALGYSVAELLGRNLHELVPKPLHARFDAYLRRIVANRTDTGVLQLTGRDGVLHTWQYHNILDDDGDETHVLGNAQDITDRLQHERQLHELSIRDPLTGCFNRRYLSELQNELKEQASWGCIAVDLDRFKLVNDTFGHQRGDEVLVEMGQFLSRHVRSEDIVVRSGGDEFLILLREADEAATLRIVAVLDAARAGAPIAFTVGHAMRGHGETIDAALAKADKQLYAVRAATRG
jgi:diguanylate cyclase (GGDEF)-like protein/PAS domain S-box-containing protein